MNTMNQYRQPYQRARQAGNQSGCCSSAVPVSCDCGNRPAPVSCGCDSYSNDMFGFPLAMAYVPWQPWCNLYSTEQALNKGTLFQDLDMDFAGRRCN